MTIPEDGSTPGILCPNGHRRSEAFKPHLVKARMLDRVQRDEAGEAGVLRQVPASRGPSRAPSFLPNCISAIDELPYTFELSGNL